MNLISNLDDSSFNKCKIFVEAKHARPSLKIVNDRKTELLELIHTNLANFLNIKSKNGKHYYITFVNDYFRYTKVYLLRSKDEVDKTFLLYKSEVENQLNRRIKDDIIHEFFALYFPQQNGIAERKNITLKEMMNALLLSYGLPDSM